MGDSLICGKTYGTKKPKLKCKRLAGHKGTHSIRRKPEEIAYLLRIGPKPRYAARHSARGSES